MYVQFPGYGMGRKPGHTDLDDTCPCINCNERATDLDAEGLCEKCAEDARVQVYPPESDAT